MSKKYTFQEITNKEELEKLFRLRYSIYSICRMRAFLKINKDLIDIDPYDIHSRHFALTCENKYAGYLRVVLQKEEITQKPVIQLAKKYQVLNDEKSDVSGKLAPLPFLNCPAVPNSYHEFYKSITARKEKMVEASRLVLHPEFRSIRSSMFLIECAMVLYILICLGMKHSIISCFEDHAKFYKYYGFKEVVKNDGFHYPGVNGSKLFQALILSGKPSRNHSKFQEMADEFNTTSKIEREF